MKTLIVGLALTGMLAVVPVRAGHMQEQIPAQMQMGQCPMKLGVVTVSMADTSNGVAVTFTAKPEDVKELQGRVERMATMHNTMSSMPGGAPHMIAGSAKYEATATGARLALAPQDPAKLKEFREQVRTRVEQMKTGDCSMMQDMMMNGMTNGMMPGADKTRVTPK